jgi:hypothetical protein
MTKEGAFDFLALPKELRERIYTFIPADVSLQHIENSNTFRPIEAAITRTSRPIREESLPLNYVVFPLIVQVFVKFDSLGNVWLTADKWHMNFNLSKSIG